MALFRNMKGIFQESGDIFRNVAYFTIKVQNTLTQVSCKTSFNIAKYSTLFLPPKCKAESFTSTSCIIFSGLQLASVRAKDMYNLMNFCIHTSFFAKDYILFCITGRFSDSHIFTRYGNIFPINYALTSLYFI